MNRLTENQLLQELKKAVVNGVIPEVTLLLMFKGFSKNEIIESIDRTLDPNSYLKDRSDAERAEEYLFRLNKL